MADHETQDRFLTLSYCCFLRRPSTRNIILSKVTKIADLVLII